MLETFSSSQIGRRFFVCNWVLKSTIRIRNQREKKGIHVGKKESNWNVLPLSLTEMTISTEVGSFWKEKPPTSTWYVCFLTCGIFLHNICLYKLFCLLTFHTAHGYASLLLRVYNFCLKAQNTYFLFWY